MRLTGIVYRAHNPRWSFAPDLGEGAAITGGRFNRTDLLALYTARRFETAWLEAQQAFPFKAQPMTLCAYDVDCDDVLDLTDPATRATHGIGSADLACPWKDLSTRGKTPPSWALADRLIASGCAGIIVPSFASGATTADVNVVFWIWGSGRPHQVCVIDDHAGCPEPARHGPPDGPLPVAGVMDTISRLSSLSAESIIRPIRRSDGILNATPPVELVIDSSSGSPG